ncbi:MAG: rubredoxin-like domain-containing protein [bacterium]|jgi:rubredoxin
MWRCTVCGYIHTGGEAPEKCPKCGASRDKFTKIEEKTRELIERSRFTNLLLAELYSLLDQAQEIAAQGKEDNLDPNCVAIFDRLGKEGGILQQMIKAEIAAHIAKNKWG